MVQPARPPPAQAQAQAQAQELWKQEDECDEPEEREECEPPWVMMGRGRGTLITFTRM